MDVALGTRMMKYPAMTVTRLVHNRTSAARFEGGGVKMVDTALKGTFLA